jgi:hypothetical protein
MWTESAELVRPPVLLFARGREKRNTPISPKINAILGPSTQTNMTCKMTKIPVVFYENDLDIVLSFV